MEYIEMLETAEIMEDVILNIYGTNDDPYFLAVDVAKLIDYSIGNTEQMLRNVDNEEKKKFIVRNTNMSNPYTVSNARGNAVKKWFLNEFGLYEVLMQSRKPLAKLFKHKIKVYLMQMRKRKYDSMADYLAQLFVEGNTPEDDYLSLCALREDKGVPFISPEEYCATNKLPIDKIFTEEFLEKVGTLYEY